MQKLEKVKMLEGNWFDSRAIELKNDRNTAWLKSRKLLEVAPESDEQFELLKQFLGSIGEGSVVRPPFFVDYGYNITLGDGCFINFDCVILDTGKVMIGNNVFIGPSSNIYAVDHHIDKFDKRYFVKGIDVIIEDNVWIGGNSTILPGITIGRNSVIGAGTVVTKDVESYSIYVGNPAKKIKIITSQ